MENKWTKTIQTSAFDESKFKVGQAYLVRWPMWIVI